LTFQYHLRIIIPFSYINQFHPSFASFLSFQSILVFTAVHLALIYTNDKEFYVSLPLYLLSFNLFSFYISPSSSRASHYLHLNLGLYYWLKQCYCFHFLKIFFLNQKKLSVNY